MKLTNFLTIILCFYLTSAYGQEVISAAGSQWETTSGSLCRTVGEALSETLSDGTGTLTQGFQQSKLTVTAINVLKVSGIQMFVYPNPTHDFLSVEVKIREQVDLILNLFDKNLKQ